MSNFFKALSRTFGVSGAEKISRNVAKDRLSVMLVHQRNNDVIQNIDMDALQAEVAGVIAKYVNIARHANANVGLKQEGDLDVLEMHFPLDQNSLGTAGGQKKMTVGKYADANN